MEKKNRILVVDDNTQNLRLMEAMLTPLDYEVILAGDGEETLKKVQESPPDLILLDIMMPKINGFEVTRRLKQEEETKIIPIVMVVPLRKGEFKVQALEAGVDNFLTRPVSEIELRAKVRSLLKVKAYNDHMRNHQKELEIEVATRTKQLGQALKQIKETSLETLHRLSRAAEYRDEDTGVHIQRMGHYAAAIARQMGLDKSTVESILYATPMHDVGKIGIPDHILLKPGRLTQGEWEIMKQHTTIGKNILADSATEFIRMAEAIAATHHERWDGSGYPEGLKGSQIPLAGRIAAIADVFDATTSRRPYRREPLSSEEAFRIITEGRERHFDPQVVDAFFATVDEILSIKEEYKAA